MPTVTVLVGLPACGKSTWREANENGAFVFSTDDLVEAEARRLGKTYDDIWAEYVNTATKLANKMLNEAIAENRDVIVDRTNLSIGARRKILSRFPESYRKVAVYFPLTDDMSRYAERLLKRPGKTINWNIIERMIKDFSVPTDDEGFEEIEIYSSWN